MKEILEKFKNSFKTIWLFLILCLTLLFGGCTDKETATRILKQDGFTHIELTGYSFWGCSRDDTFSTGFVAQKNGKTIEGSVCNNFFFKNATIRYK